MSPACTSSACPGSTPAARPCSASSTTTPPTSPAASLPATRPVTCRARTFKRDAKLAVPERRAHGHNNVRRRRRPVPGGRGHVMKVSASEDVYGSADRLRLSEIEKPVIAAGEVLVQVRAAGVDRGTCHLMRGEPYLVRISGFGFRGPKNRVPGLDVAGTVAAAGAGVTRFQAGDEVFGIARGSFAEYAAAQEDKLVAKPAGLSFEQAATVAVSGLAAVKGL